jgi:hypothetical protein
VVEEERYRTQRTWLRGAGGGTALILDFAAASAPLPSALVPGTEVDADLAFFPGSHPQRALVAAVDGEAGSMARWRGSATLAEALAVNAGALAANPWLDRLPFVVADVTPLARDDEWWLRDIAGSVVRLRLDEPAWWVLAAVSGGRPVGLAGEWHDGGLHPLSVWADRRLTVLP